MSIFFYGSVEKDITLQIGSHFSKLITGKKLLERIWQILTNMAKKLKIYLWGYISEIRSFNVFVGKFIDECLNLNMIKFSISEMPTYRQNCQQHLLNFFFNNCRQFKKHWKVIKWIFIHRMFWNFDETKHSLYR